MATTIIQTKRTKASVAQIKAAFGCKPAEVRKAAEQRWNCEEASCDADGDVWIEGPMRGHWLDEEELQSLVEWWEAEVGLSILDQLGTAAVVAALKASGVSRQQIADRLGISLRALENKIANVARTTLAETEVMRTMAGEHAALASFAE